MNTDKLLKAIQILIKEELKEALPKLVKEAVRVETAKLLGDFCPSGSLKFGGVESEKIKTPRADLFGVIEGRKRNPHLNDIISGILLSFDFKFSIPSSVEVVLR